MANLLPNLTGAGLYKCEIRLADGNVYQLKAANSLSSTPDSQVTDIEGDDIQLASYTFTKGQEISFEMNGLSIEAIQALTGNPYLGSSVSKFVIPLGSTLEINPPFFELKGYTRARDFGTEKARILLTYLKCQIQGGIEITQEYQGAFSIQFTMKAFQTDVDITGAAIDGLTAGEKLIYTITAEKA